MPSHEGGPRFESLRTHHPFQRLTRCLDPGLDGECETHLPVLQTEGLMVRRLKRKRLVRTAPVNAHLTTANQGRALDFVCGALATGRGLPILT